MKDEALFEDPDVQFANLACAMSSVGLLMKDAVNVFASDPILTLEDDVDEQEDEDAHNCRLSVSNLKFTPTSSQFLTGIRTPAVSAVGDAAVWDPASCLTLDPSRMSRRCKHERR